MKTRFALSLVTVLAVAAAGLASGCGGTTTHHQVPPDLGSDLGSDLATAIGDLALTATDLAPASDMARSSGACATTGAEITTLPTCATAAGSTVDVTAGCVPTVDGVLHAAEWSDATCFNTVFGDASTDEVIYMKYAGDSLYFASSGEPQSGGTMNYFFDPTAAATFNTSQFYWAVFDDPFGTNGDGAGSGLTNGQPAASTPAPSGIVVLCPGSQPDPIRYEWKIPLTALGITPGTAHTFSLGYVNQGSAKGNSQWPKSLTVSAGNSLYPGDPSTWGRLSSSTKWK